MVHVFHVEHVHKGAQFIRLLFDYIACIPLPAPYSTSLMKLFLLSLAITAAFAFALAKYAPTGRTVPRIITSEGVR